MLIRIQHVRAKMLMRAHGRALLRGVVGIVILMLMLRLGLRLRELALLLVRRDNARGEGERARRRRRANAGLGGRRIVDDAPELLLLAVALLLKDLLMDELRDLLRRQHGCRALAYVSEWGGR